ncbi:PREDICTED: protein FAM71C-like [Thamnophis sirtalis]|uniref:Protein FAM71C-like n=1 Tax=Thamnophis sirtalis TaxID=35019 RepID=A0A6I9XHG4_9SAUR|nr:PREDICTED: protein FAM71C-like [Thamnophis sirtalis]
MESLENLLHQGEYNMFQYAPMFESDFFQISKEGNPIEVHNKKKVITLGVTSTIPTLPIPNTLLLASSLVSSEEHISKSTSIFHQHFQGNLELKRLFPLCLVKISIHNMEKQQLRLKLVTGRTYYLQLYPASHQQQNLFVGWIKLVQTLRPSSKTNVNQQKPENQKLKKKGAPLVPPPKPKTPPPQRESQCTPAKKTKEKKKSIRPVIQNPTTKAKETKKGKAPTAVRSKSSPTPKIKPPPLKIENIHEASCKTTPEEKNIAKKLEKEKTKNPVAGGEKENLDINRYRYVKVKQK